MAQVRLAQNRRHRVTGGHPWVYRTEVAEITGEFSPGDIVEVVDFKKRFIGKGYINPASQILVRIMTRDPEEKIDREFLVRRITAAVSRGNPRCCP